MFEPSLGWRFDAIRVAMHVLLFVPGTMVIPLPAKVRRAHLLRYRLRGGSAHVMAPDGFGASQRTPLPGGAYAH
jgi:hypothetical protein